MSAATLFESSVPVDVPHTLKAARAYHRRGLAVLPLNGKAPATGHGVKDASTDLDQIDEWFATPRNIGIAIPELVVVVDVDPRNGGLVTYTDWMDTYGADDFDAVPTAMTGGGDGGMHFWFRHDGTKLVKTINGVDFLRVGKYVVAPPSVTNARYTWKVPLPPDLGDLPAMPAWLAQLAGSDEEPTIASTLTVVSSGGDALDDAAHAYTSWDALLERHGWTPVGENGWRHPSSDNRISATIKYDCLFVYSPNTPLPVTEEGDPHGVTLFRAIETLDFGGDRSRFLDALRAGGYLPERSHTQLWTPDGAVDVNEPGFVSAPVLPDEFWSSRPVLRHVREAARARLIAPDGVLAAVLMGVAAQIDFRIVLPDIVGRFGSLNSAAVLVAPSGGGKGSSVDTARDLIPYSRLGTSRFKEAPVGSGEGMVVAYFERKREKGPDGKYQQVWEQRFDSIAFRVDEGELLKDLGARSGQTTMAVLRSAWSGEQLGNSYADRERRGLILPSHSYRASLIMGVQPEHADFLLADAAGGTPQRFLWSSLVDPDAPDLDRRPAWPGPIDWQPPGWQEAEPVHLNGFQRALLSIAPPIVETIRQNRLDITRGRAEPDPLDAHADLVRLKTAALLAALDHRVDIRDDDWAIAGIICATSADVRRWVQTQIRAAAERAQTRSVARAVDKAVAVEAAISGTQTKVERVADALARCVDRAGSDGITSGKLRANLTSRDRALFDPAVNDATERGLITLRDDGRYHLAESVS